MGASQASDVGSIPIARSINPDDSVDLTRLSSLNSTKKRCVLDGSWTVPDSIGRSVGTHISSPDRKYCRLFHPSGARCRRELRHARSQDTSFSSAEITSYESLYRKR